MVVGLNAINTLFLQNQKNHTATLLTLLSHDKSRLAKDMQAVTREYQQSLNANVYKWSQNNGVSYTELSYSNLMTPSAMNQNKPYLLTDLNGKVVLDDKYKEYAEMISPNGAPGGNWEANRAKILEGLTGVSADKLTSSETYSTTAETLKKEIEEKKLAEPKKDSFTKSSTDELLKKLGSSTGASNGFSSGSDWSSAYRLKSNIELGDKNSAKSALNSIVNNISNKLSPYFMENADKFKEAANTLLENYTGLIDKDDESLSSNNEAAIYKDGDNYKLNVQAFITTLLAGFIQNGGEEADVAYDNANLRCVWYDVDSNQYKNWKIEHDNWQKELDQMIETYDNAINEGNQVLDASQEQKITFYDTLFSAIAEKGWTHNENATDPDYLNQMLQNNLYTLTSVEKVEVIKNGQPITINEYTSNIASNCENIFEVNDTNIRNQALIDYEFKKSTISEKESRIDEKMKNLETRLSAYNTMLQSTESRLKDGIEMRFNIFS